MRQVQLVSGEQNPSMHYARTAQAASQTEFIPGKIGLKHSHPLELSRPYRPRQADLLEHTVWTVWIFKIVHG